MIGWMCWTRCFFWKHCRHSKLDVTVASVTEIVSSWNVKYRTDSTVVIRSGFRMWPHQFLWSLFFLLNLEVKGSNVMYFLWNIHSPPRFYSRSVAQQPPAPLQDVPKVDITKIGLEVQTSWTGAASGSTSISFVWNWWKLLGRKVKTA